LCSRLCAEQQGTVIMLEYPSEKVRNCLRHAEQCGHRAKIEPDPNLARDYLDMERRWLSLARSYAATSAAIKSGQAGTARVRGD
jgi:hypothetical protein